MTEIATHLVGLLGNFFSIYMFVPTAQAVWRNRHDEHALRSAPIRQQMLIICNALVWGLYALLTGAYWSALPGVVNLPLATFVIHLILRARDDTVATPDDDDLERESAH